MLTRATILATTVWSRRVERSVSVSGLSGIGSLQRECPVVWAPDKARVIYISSCRPTYVQLY